MSIAIAASYYDSGSTRSCLGKANLLLSGKNCAIEELMTQLEAQKGELARNLADHCERTIFPLLSRLRTAGPRLAPQFAKVLEDNLRDLTDRFCAEPTKELRSLTPRELEVANLVRGGMSAKEIAELLSISRRSVDNHRNNIRKKLGLTNQEVNLTTYLRSL